VTGAVLDPQTAQKLGRVLWLGLGMATSGLLWVWKKERDAERVNRKVMSELRRNNPRLQDRGFTVEKWANLPRQFKLGVLNRVRRMK
jgi:hypothetical protein